MVSASAPARRAAALTLLIAATFAALAAYPHMQHLTAIADTGWWAALEVIAVDGLVLATGLVLVTGARRTWWSAWLTVVLSIPVNAAVVVAPTQPLMAWLVGLWPAVAVSLGCLTFIRNRRRLHSRREGDQ
jgi:hypothetical protein